MQYPKQHPTYKHLIAARIVSDNIDGTQVYFLDDNLDDMNLGTGNAPHLLAHIYEQGSIQDIMGEVYSMQFRGNKPTKRLSTQKSTITELQQLDRGYDVYAWIHEENFSRFLSEAEYYGYDVPA